MLSILNMSETNYTQNSYLNKERCEMSTDSFFLQIFQLIFFSIILICSFVGNVLIIIVVRVRQELRRTMNFFIVNMAVSDMIFPLASLPFSVAAISANSRGWPISGTPGLALCKLSVFLTAASVTVSVQSLIWISLDRFVAVVLPLKALLISSRFRAFAIASTWVVAVLINSTDLYTMTLIQESGGFHCTREKNLSLVLKTTMYFRVVLISIAPLLLITALYSAIAVTLKRRNATLSCSSTKDNDQRKRQALKMSLCIIVAFNLCVLLYIIMAVAGLQDEFPVSCLGYKVLWFLALFGLYFTSVVNPSLCFTFIESYRRGLREIFTSRRAGRKKIQKSKNRIK